MISRNSLKTLLTTMFLATGAAPALAVDYTWNGQFNNLWDHQFMTFTNWGPSGIPGSGDTVTFSTASIWTVDLNGNRTISAATINSSAPYTLNTGSDTLTVSDITVSSALGTITHTIIMLS